MQYQIINTCGTSVLTNIFKKKNIPFNVNKYSNLYQEKVWPIVTDKIREGQDFRNSLKCIANDKERVLIINERLDDLSLYAISNKTQIIQRLDYKKLKNNNRSYQYECDAWADKDAKRLFCNEVDGIIVVEKLDKALH